VFLTSGFRAARRRWSSPVVVAYAIVLSSCAGSSGGDAVNPTSMTAPAQNLTGEFRLGEPFGQLSELSLRSEVLFSAVEEHIQACMEDRGFRYETRAIADPGDKGIAQAVMDTRQQNPDEIVGYGFSEWNAAQPAPQGVDTAESVEGIVSPDVAVDPNDPNAWVYELSGGQQEAWRHALDGLDIPPEDLERVTIGADGSGKAGWAPDACMTKGREAIYGPLKQWVPAEVMVTEEIPNQGVEMLQTDPKVEQGIDAWAACMTKAGYEVKDLKDPIRILRLRFPPGSDPAASTAAEAEMAPVDARCFQDADLPTILGNAQRQVEAELLDQHEGVIAAYVELYDAALARARGEG